MSKLNSLIISILLFFFFHGTAQQINVLTYNIRYASFDSVPENWDQRKAGVTTILKGHDFIGLQEVMPVQMTYISKILGDEYGFLFRTREADPDKGEGCPVFFKKSRWEVLSSGYFWLSGTPDIPGSNTWGAAYNRIVTFGVFRELVSGDSILVINAHFDHISQPAREKSINLILDKFAREIIMIPVIFMGDLNVKPENPVYQMILATGKLTDSFQSIHHKESNAGATFHGWKTNPAVDRIDYIFCSPKLKVKSSKVLHDKYNGMYPSDHFPLHSRFKF